MRVKKKKGMILSQHSASDFFKQIANNNNNSLAKLWPGACWRRPSGWSYRRWWAAAKRILQRWPTGQAGGRKTWNSSAGSVRINPVTSRSRFYRTSPPVTSRTKPAPENTVFVCFLSHFLVSEQRESFKRPASCRQFYLCRSAVVNQSSGLMRCQE